LLEKQHAGKRTHETRLPALERSFLPAPLALSIALSTTLIGALCAGRETAALRLTAAPQTQPKQRGQLCHPKNAHMHIYVSINEYNPRCPVEEGSPVGWQVVAPTDRFFGTLQTGWPAAWQSTRTDTFWAEQRYGGSHVADVSKHYPAQSGVPPPAAGGCAAGGAQGPAGAAELPRAARQGPSASSCSRRHGNGGRTMGHKSSGRPPWRARWRERARCRVGAGRRHPPDKEYSGKQNKTKQNNNNKGKAAPGCIISPNTPSGTPPLATQGFGHAGSPSFILVAPLRGAGVGVKAGLHSVKIKGAPFPRKFVGC